VFNVVVITRTEELGRKAEDLRNTRNVVNMITQCNEQIKEQLRSSSLHFQLHGAAALEGAAGADYEGEIVRTQFRVGVRGVGVGVAGG
jgi:hypothetical protein